MARLTALSPPTKEKLLQSLNRREVRSAPPLNAVRPVSHVFVNTEAVPVPPYGAIWIQEAVDLGDRYGFEAGMPTSETDRIAFNGPNTVGGGKRGQCYFGPLVRGAYQSEPVPGLPIPGHVGLNGWYLDATSGYNSVFCHGIVDTTKKLMLVEIVEEDTAFFKSPSGGIPAAGSSLGAWSCEKLWSHFGSSTPVSGNPPVFRDVFNYTSRAIGGGKTLIAEKISGRWFVIVEPCD